MAEDFLSDESLLLNSWKKKITISGITIEGFWKIQEESCFWVIWYYWQLSEHKAGFYAPGKGHEMKYNPKDTTKKLIRWFVDNKTNGSSTQFEGNPKFKDVCYMKYTLREPIHQV